MTLMLTAEYDAFSLSAQLALLLLVTAILGFVARWTLNRIRQIKKTPEWLKTLCDSLYKPSAWLIWVSGFFIVLEIASEAVDIFVSGDILGRVRNIFVSVLLAWVVLDWKSRYEKVLKRRVRHKDSKAQDEVLILAISKVATFFIVIVVGLIILEILEIPLTALLAFGGVGGVAVGFAGKDVVANFFGGLMIHIVRPFFLGERIMSANKNFDGVVEEIGWYCTRIRTLERRPMYIPNALFIDAIIENLSRMYNRRIKETVGVRYEDVKKIEPIVEGIRSLLKNHPEIDQDQILAVHFLHFGASSLDIDVHCFTKTRELQKWRDVQQEIFLSIADIVESHGAEIAFPTRTVHMQEALPPASN